VITLHKKQVPILIAMKIHQMQMIIDELFYPLE
jgi:hypothetical protein